jgi:predicted NodU family carbamoyl transferase
MKSFNTADSQTVAALQRMNHPDMHALLAFLKSQFDDTKTALIRADGEVFHRLQGRAGFLEELLSAVETATETLEKMR